MKKVFFLKKIIFYFLKWNFLTQILRNFLYFYLEIFFLIFQEGACKEQKTKVF